MHGRGLLEMGLLAGSVVTIPMQLLSHLSFVDSTMSSTNATSSGSVQHSSVGFVRAFGDSAMKRYLENWFNWMHAQCKGWGFSDAAADWLSWGAFGLFFLFLC